MRHAHVCPRCNRQFDHERFVYHYQWDALQRIVARSLHRFYGACAPCIRKFMEGGGGFDQDKEINQLRTVELQSGGVLFTQKKPDPFRNPAASTVD